jgi:protein TonB
MKLNLYTLAFSLALTTPAFAKTEPVPIPVKATPQFSIPTSENVDVLPQVIKYGAPKYPKKWIKYRLEGYAVIEFVIDHQGIPREVQCSEATDIAFADAAIEQVKEWRFTAGTKDGKRVAIRSQQRLNFALK